ncbi:MAG: ligase-associated DNA damage response endonuclease PdeM [Daejeonella sp.]
MEITLKNNTFKLCEQKALFWKEENLLLISDLHIGKIAHFRKAGIALPQKAIDNNFIRLDILMQSNNVKKILFIGDLFHSDINQEWDLFCKWRSNYSTIKMQIVLGNHDRLPGSFCNDFNISITQKELDIFPFIFSHHPRKVFKTADEYIFSGHVHPVIQLRGKANQRIKLPCFYFGQQQAILPSFGYFTGGYAMDVLEKDRVIAIANEKLIVIK